MFRIAFLIEGVHLEKVLTVLTGKAINMEGPTLVVNAIKKGKRVIAKSKAGSQTARLEMALTKKFNTGDQVTSTQVLEIMKAEHMSEENYTYLTQQLRKRNVLTSVTRGVFTFLRPESDFNG